MFGSAWNSPCGIIPFGNVIFFLHPGQVMPISLHDQASRTPKLEFPDVLPKEEEIPSTLVNFVFSPKNLLFSSRDLVS